MRLIKTMYNLLPIYCRSPLRGKGSLQLLQAYPPSISSSKKKISSRSFKQMILDWNKELLGEGDRHMTRIQKRAPVSLSSMIQKIGDWKASHQRSSKNGRCISALSHQAQIIPTMLMPKICSYYHKSGEIYIAYFLWVQGKKIHQTHKYLAQQHVLHL